MKPLTVSFFTLGCKLNQLETESAADSMAKAGMEIRPFGEPADLFVVNTCTVTGKAEQKARHSLRKALSLNPDGVALATGCYAQMDPLALSSLHPRVVVLPGEEKSALLGLGEWLQENWQGHGDLIEAVRDWKISLRPGFDPFAYEPNFFAFHSRPSIKVEDGCDNRCSYCRVCLARGPAVSLSKEVILSRVKSLEASGKAEVVLTGVNLSQYLDSGASFPKLLEYLVENTEKIAFRISSYEPDRIDADFLRAIASPRVRPHVHLSVQSGSSGVLRRMSRPYTAERLKDVVAGLRATKGDLFLAADVIAGFPGETETEFDETLSLCEELDFAWIHSFPFSARPGTRAFGMLPKIPERVTGERVSALMDMARRNKRAYVGRWVGREVDLVLESSEEAAPEDGGPGLSERATDAVGLGLSAHGTSENYLKLQLPSLPHSQSAGAAIKVRIVSDSAESPFDAAAELV